MEAANRPRQLEQPGGRLNPDAGGAARRGQSHPAIALGIAATEAGYRTYFPSATDLVSSLQSAHLEGTALYKMRTYTGPSVLVVDELGYLPLDQASANWIFQMVSRRYEKGSIVLTSNRGFGDWDQTTSIDTVALTYNGLGQDDLRSDGNTSFASGTLGLSLLTNSNGTSHFIRDNQGGLIGVVEGGGSEYYYLSDGLGSVVGLTNVNGGEPLSYTYSPYGVSTPSATQGVPQNQLQFTGALQDNASNPDGIDHMGARFYDPSIGRWTQQDPISNPASPQGWDRYVYAGDDPVNYADPTGACGLSSWGDFGDCFNGLLPIGTGCGVGAVIGGTVSLVAGPEAIPFGAFAGCVIGIAATTVAHITGNDEYDWYIEGLGEEIVAGYHIVG